MKRIAAITVLSVGWLICGPDISAQGADTDSGKKREWLETKVFSRLYRNPSTAFQRPDTLGVGRVESSYGYRSSEGLQLLSEGSSEGKFELIAEGRGLRANKIFWGKVGYSNSANERTAWTNVTDPFRVGPYQVADSIGGDTYSEEYLLNGGVAIPAGKWIMSGEAGYRAGHQYRKTDPRPKSTTTDLYGKLSTGYSFRNKYLVGVTLQAGKYEQELNINVQRDNNKFNFFVMRGFGMYHLQESTYASNFSWRYKGSNFETTFFFLPSEGSGLSGYSTMRYENIDSYPGGNYIPFSFKTLSFNNEIGWKKRTEHSFRFARLNYQYNLSKGTERVFQYQKVNEVFGQYFLLSSNNLFTRKEVGVNLEAGKEWINGALSKWLIAKVGYQSYGQRYSFPVYRNNYNYLLSSMRMGVDISTAKRWVITPEFGCWYKPILEKEELLIEKSELYDASFKPDTEIYKANVVGVNMGITCKHNLRNSLQLYASLRGEYQFAGDLNRRYGQLTIGINY